MDNECAVEQFKNILNDQPDVSPAIAALTVLLDFLNKDTSETIQGLHSNIKSLVEDLNKVDGSVTSVKSASELFMRFITLASLDHSESSIMPGGRTKFQEKWLESKDGNGDTISNWCVKGKNEWEAYCMLCKCSLLVSNAGISQLLQHASRAKHCTAVKQLKGQQKLGFSRNNINEGETEISSGVKPILTVNLNADQLVTRTEALWAIKIAVSNYSFASCRGIVPLFRAMFENHPISNNMNLSDRKVSYILAHGLGPVFREEVVSDLQAAMASGSYFTLAFDETTTVQVKKQLDIIVRFWSPTFNQIVSGYLTSLFLGHATSDDICSGILRVLEANKLPLNKILMLSMDGPNVNLAVAKKLNGELANLGSPELIDLGTCALHKVHNCFSKALDSIPLDIDEFATDLFAFFKLSAARREDFKELQKLLECEPKVLLRHVNSRWLTLGPVVTRILSLYSALKEYFLQVLPKGKNNWGSLQKNARYKRIASALKDPLTVVYLEFISAVSPNLQEYLSFFQTEGPLVHLMYSKMNLLLRSVMLRFLNETTVGNLEGESLLSIDMENHANYRLLKDMNVGEDTRRALTCIHNNERKMARMAMRSFLLKLSRLLRDALPLSDNFLHDLEKLHPAMRAVRTDSAIRRLCLKLKPLKMDSQSIDKIMLEWQMYVVDTEVDRLCKDYCNPGRNKSQRIDVFWKNVFSLTDKISGKPKYVNLSILIKNCLSLAHGNADVERGFSVNNSIITESRASLSEAVIIAIRHVKEAVNRYGDICAIPITVKLLNSVVKSHAMYVAAKEAEKTMTRENEKKRTLEEREQKAVNEAKKFKKETDEKVKEIDNAIKILKDELFAAQNCLAEGNKRLQTALKKKDFNDMRIASTMIDAATGKIQEITVELNKAQDKRNKLQSSLHN